MFPKIEGFPPKWMVKIMDPNPMNKWMIWGYQSHGFYRHRDGTSPNDQKVQSFRYSRVAILSDDGYTLWGLQNELA